MARYLVHQSDRNAAPIIEAMRKAGACVEPLGRPVDVLLTVDGLTTIAEIKTAKGKTRSRAQAAFLKRWRGPCPILRTVDEGVALVNRLKSTAAVLSRGWDVI